MQCMLADSLTSRLSSTCPDNFLLKMKLKLITQNCIFKTAESNVMLIIFFQAM